MSTTPTPVSADDSASLGHPNRSERDAAAPLPASAVTNDAAPSSLTPEVGDAIPALPPPPTPVKTIHGPVRTRPQNRGRGIVDDFKATVYTYWKEEMTNVTSKTLPVSLYMFFACMAPALTFGAMFGKITENRIGALEMIVATAWNGILFALIGGQPIMINGATGPVLAFAGVLYELAGKLDVPYLAFKAYVGYWISFYMLLAAFTDFNRFIQYATRFTDEVFAMLIAFIFIVDAFGNPFYPVGLFYYFDPHHKTHQKHADDESYNYMEVALLSVILGLGTTSLAFFLRGLKFSPFLWCRVLRTTVSDFGATIAVFVFTFVNQVLFPDIQTEELKIPSTLTPSFVCCTKACDTQFPDDCPDQDEAYGPRPWFVNLTDLNGKPYLILIAAAPAMLAFVLLFLDSGITKHLMDHPSHKLTHGQSYNYDMALIGLMIAVNSTFGLPWLIAATVRSLNHLDALAEKSPDGKIIYSVLETRLTGILTHTYILGSLFALDVLKLIPVPVLYGIFLYMGLTTLPTNQFWNRMMLVLMDPSKYKVGCNYPFVDHVTIWRIHLFTFMQMLLFAALYLVKTFPQVAVGFPIVIAACMPTRSFILPRMFNETELLLLDGDDLEIEEFVEEYERATRKQLAAEEISDEGVDEENSVDGQSAGKDGSQSLRDA